MDYKKGTKAPQAAGKIHSDIERGFIRAEIVSYDDLIREGSINAVKERGLMRSEGKKNMLCKMEMLFYLDLTYKKQKIKKMTKKA